MTRIWLVAVAAMSEGRSATTGLETGVAPKAVEVADRRGSERLVRAQAPFPAPRNFRLLPK